MTEITKYSNSSVAKLLTDLAAALTILGENSFRIRAYQNAAAAINQLSSSIKDAWEEGTLQEVPGIGKNIGDYLDEYFKTGHIKHFEATFKKMPEGMFNILGLPEIGPKTAYRLSGELGITSQAELIKAARAHKISKLEGFGEESEKDILSGLEKMTAKETRYLLSQAIDVSDRYIQYLKTNPAVMAADALGSTRRRLATVGDIDIAVSTSNSAAVSNFFVSYPQVLEVVSQGNQKATVILKTGEQVDLMTQSPEGYGSLLQHFTGSKSHNIALREMAKKDGLSLSEYGVKEAGKALLEFKTEETFYKSLGLDLIPPELRENRGEIEAARDHKLPDLVELKDIKGDLHNHTDFIEGENSLEEMIQAAKVAGFSYYAYCDHAPSIENRGRAIVGKIVADRRKFVDEYNKKSPDLKLFLGFEVNIAATGDLAWPNELLKQLDFVVASIHTNHKDSKEKITSRLLSALSNPYVSIIGHPSGRLLLERPSSDIDWARVFKAAASSGKILEINAHPKRLDLADDLIFEARKAGIKFLVSTDAHNVDGLNVLPYGVWTARRGWLGAKEVVNAWNFEKLKSYLEEIKRR